MTKLCFSSLPLSPGGEKKQKSLSSFSSLLSLALNEFPLTGKLVLSDVLSAPFP